MAKVASKSVNITVNSVALEDDMKSFSLDVTQANPEVTGLDNAGPRRVADNYDWKLSMQGGDDFASGQSDATLFGMLGSAGVSLDLDPTGTTAGVSNPHYTGTVMLGSMKISGQVGQGVEVSAELVGTSALTRATS